MKNNPSFRHILFASIALLLPASLLGQAYWLNSGTGNWFDTASWSTGVLPTGGTGETSIVSNGTAVISSGNAEIFQAFSIGYAGVPNVTTDIMGGLIINGSGTLTMGNVQTYIGRRGGSTSTSGYGTVLVTGSGFWKSGADISLARSGAASTGYLEIAESGSIQSVTMHVGYSEKANGTMLIKDNGRLTTAGASVIGGNGSGNTSVGLITIRGSGFWINTSTSHTILMGSYGTGTMFLEESGSFATTRSSVTANAVSIGDKASGNGAIIASGFSDFTVATGVVLVGNAGKGIFTLADNATAKMSGIILANSGTGSSGIINLDGGVLTTGAIEHRAGTGVVNFNSGTLRAGADSGAFISSTGDGSFSMNINSSAAFIDTQDFAVSTSAAFKGSGGLVKLGAGQLELTGAQAYTGFTDVTSGTLALGGGNVLVSSTAVNIAANAVVSITGTQTLNNLAGNGTVAGTSHVILNSTADTTFAGGVNFGMLEKSGAATLTLSKTGSIGAGQDIAVTQGALVITGGTLFTAPTGVTSVAAGATLGIAAGSSLVSTGTLTLASGAIVNVTGYTPSLAAGVTLVSTGGDVGSPLANATLFLDGQQYEDTTDKYLQTFLMLGAGNKDLLVTSTLYWYSTGTAHGTYNILAGDLFTVPVALNDRANGTYAALAGWDGKSLVKTGSGTLVFSSANTYTGATNVSNGTLRLSIADAIATSTAVNLSAGSTLDAATGAQTLRDLSGGGAILGNSASVITLHSTNNTIYAGSITGAGSMEKTGAGSLLLSGTGAFGATGTLAIAQGQLAVTRGTLAVADKFTLAASATLGISADGAKITVGSADFLAGSVINILSGTGTVNILESVAAITTPLSNITLRNNGAAGAADAVSLDVYNTYGLQLVNSHKTLQATTTLIWTSAGQAHGTFNIADGIVFAPAVALTDRVGGSFTAFADWDGKTLNKTGAGTLNLSIASGYTGVTTVSNGTLQLTAPNAIASSTAVNLMAGAIVAQGAQQTFNNFAGSASGTLVNSAVTTLQSSADTAFAGVITGTGGITKTGAGTLTLSGSNDYSGGTTISAGKVIAANAAALGAGKVTNNTALEFALVTDGVFAASLAGTGSFAKTGAGLLTATGSTFTTAVATVTGGTLAIGDATHAVTASAGSVAVGSSAGLAMGADSTLAVAGTMSLADNSSLSFMIGSGTGPVISAADVGIGSNVTLNLAGITGSTEMPFYVIDTQNGIAGEFANITIGGATGGTPDYLTIATSKTSDGKKYELDAFLTWTQTGTVRHGTFTLVDADGSFNVGQVLADKAANTLTGWDGKSLAKDGAGTLILSAVNTYTGTTLVNAGTLRLDAANAIAASIVVNIAADATLEAATGMQTLGNLTGSGTLKNSSFTILHSTLDTAFSGVVTGSGGIEKTGMATLTLAGASDYSGGTVITEGRLKTALLAALGSGEIVNNAALELALDADTAFAHALSGSGALIKTGAGTLTLATSNTAFTGTAIVESGKFLLTNVAALGESEIIVRDGTVLEFDGIKNAASQNAIAGTGTFVVTSSTLTLARGGAGIRNVDIANSTLTLADTKALGDGVARINVGAASQLLLAANGVNLDTVTLGANATLGFVLPAPAFVPKTLTIANLTAGAGAKLSMNVNLGMASGGVTPGGVAGDFLRVTGTLSGQYAVVLNPGPFRPQTYNVSVELINTVAPTADDAFVLSGGSPRIDIGLRSFEFVQGNGSELLPNPNSWYLADTGISPVADVIFSAAAMAGVDWHYSLDSLNLRLGDIRATCAPADGETPPKTDRWMRVRGYRLDAESSLTGAAFYQYVYGVTAGIDRIFHLENSSIVIGVLVDAAKLSRSFDNGATGDTRTISGGLYASWLHKAGWYADGVAKYDHNENRFNIRFLAGQPDDTEYKNDVQGLSLELGRRFQRENGWWLELAAQGAVAWIGGADYDTYPDHLKLHVEVEEATSVQYRAQMRLGRHLFSTRFHPYVRVGVAKGETFGGKINAGLLRRKVDFDGWRAEAGGGFAWHLSPHSQLYLDYEYALAESYERPWSFNLGYRRAW